jgi:hypothetical protein
VLDLLAAHEKTGDFLEHSPDSSVTHDAPTQPPLSEELSFLAPPQRPGAIGRLGHYELLDVLGVAASVLFSGLSIALWNGSSPSKSSSRPLLELAHRASDSYEKPAQLLL